MENDKLKNGINELHDIRMTSDEKRRIFENIVPIPSAPVAVKSPWSFSYFNLLIERNHLVTYVIFFFLIFITGGGVVFDIISNKNNQINNNENIDIYKIRNDNTLGSNNVATDSLNTESDEKKYVDIPITSKTNQDPTTNPKNNGTLSALPPTDRGEFSIGIATGTGTMPMVENGLNGTWVWQKTILNDETIIMPKKIGEFTLSFKEDKRVNGETDCNNFSGSYYFDNMGNINFGPLATTMMYCDGSEEKIFTNFINKSKRYEINSSGNLILFFSDGSGYLIFKK